MRILAASTPDVTAVDVDLAHLPCDVNQDGTVNIADSTAFANEFQSGQGNPDLVDMNRDGTVNVLDVTVFGDLFSGNGGFIQWNGKSLPPRP